MSFIYLILAVAPEYRGFGFGGYLLAKVLIQAVQRGSRFSYLEVRPTNKIALSLYRQMGFRRVGLRRNYYQDNGEDALLFERELGENDLAFFSEFLQSCLIFPPLSFFRGPSKSASFLAGPAHEVRRA